jgi:hypothetical protein
MASGGSQTPAGGVVSGGPQSSGGGASKPDKMVLSVEDAKFDTPLNHKTAVTWFRRLLVTAETLGRPATTISYHELRNSIWSARP